MRSGRQSGTGREAAGRREAAFPEVERRHTGTGTGGRHTGRESGREYQTRRARRAGGRHTGKADQ